MFSSAVVSDWWCGMVRNAPAGYGSLEGQGQQSNHLIQNRCSHQQNREDVPELKLSRIARRAGACKKKRSWRKIAAVCSLAIGIVAAVTWTVYPTPAGRYQISGENNFAEASASDHVRPASLQTSVSSPSKATEPLDFSALNFYHVRDGKPGQDYRWLKDVKLIEPYRETTLSVTNPRDGFEYRWEIRAESDNGGLEASANGVITVIILQKLDGHVISLEEVDSAGRVTRRLDETVMVKYVRREIRTLTNDEREELLDAVRG